MTLISKSVPILLIVVLCQSQGHAQQDEPKAAESVTVLAEPAIKPDSPDLPTALETSSAMAPMTVLPPEGAINMLENGSYQLEWVYYSAEQKLPQSETWTLVPSGSQSSPVLICKGKPFGYLRTKRRFRNYDFGFEWRYPSGDSSNSGVLLYTNGEDKIWPAAIQVQLHLSGAGSVIPVGGIKLKQGLEVREKLANHGTWHHCQIQAQDGTVTVIINGKTLGSVPDCATEDGHVALQSQGAEIQFRNLWIRQRNR